MNNDCPESPTWARLLRALSAFHEQGFVIEQMTTVLMGADTDGREEVRIAFAPGTTTVTGEPRVRAWRRAEG